MPGTYRAVCQSQYVFSLVYGNLFPFLYSRKLVANVDWALLNFMKDWFPIEAKQKLQQNEREAAVEQMEELGFKEQSCVIA